MIIVHVQSKKNSVTQYSADIELSVFVLVLPVTNLIFKNMTQKYTISLFLFDILHMMNCCHGVKIYKDVMTRMKWS